MPLQLKHTYGCGRQEAMRHVSESISAEPKLIRCTDQSYKERSRLLVISSDENLVSDPQPAEDIISETST